MSKSTNSSKTSSTPKLRITQLLFLFIGLVGTTTFGLRLVIQPDTNLTALENEMNSSATSIHLLESDPADYDNKSLSRAYGDYLVGESIAWHTQLTTLTNINTSLNLIGLLASVVIFCLGLRHQ